jgi:membrane protein
VVLGHNVTALAVRVVRRVVNVRITGLAAEMTYYTVLSLVPLVTGLGAGLGLLERVVGSATIEDLELGLIAAVEGVFSDEVVSDVVAPLIQDLLRQERAGVAIGGLLLSVWLASRVFRAAIRALDDTYEVAERRTFVQQWVLSLGFTAAAVVVVILSLSFLVIGPLLGGGAAIADWFGLGPAFEWVWGIGRWPALAAVSIGFLTWLYRAGPNVDNTWRQCLPGAVVSTVLLIAVAVGFRWYLQLAGPQAPDVEGGDQAVLIAAQLMGALAVALLFVWLSNIVVLLGGVVNAEWAHDRPVSAGAKGEEPSR